MQNDLTLLTFALDQVWYAIHALEVREVVLLPELTPLADAPPFVSGIFNLRSHIVTAIDLRQRMGLRRRPWSVKNAVLVVPSQEKLSGLIVDEAFSLITLSSHELEPAPDFSPFMSSRQDGFILAVGKLEGRLIPILDLNRIFTAVERQEVGEWQAKENHE